MCLAIPARVESVDDNQSAEVNVGGVKKQISTALIEDVIVGDYVIIHVGFALTKLDQQEAEKTLALLSQLDVE